MACFYSTIVQSERDSQVCKESRISVVKEPSLFINVNALLYLQRSLHVTVMRTHISLGIYEYADAIVKSRYTDDLRLDCFPSFFPVPRTSKFCRAGTMDEFEKAVLFQADPTHTPHEVFQQAIQLTNQVRASPTGWRFCFERFFQSSQIVVRIFCLQVISEAITHRYVKIYHPPQRAR